MMNVYFEYGETEISYLRQKDKRLCEVIDRRLFEKYRRFRPYCSVASLYLWVVAGGAIPEMKDFKPKVKAKA